MLNYQNTAFELLPLLGSAYALIFMVRAACCRAGTWSQ